MDLIDFSKTIQKWNKQNKYVLIAVDLYNRQAVTQAMPQKTAQATLEAFRKIIRKNDGAMPKEITVDLGTEHALLEKEITEKGGSCEGGRCKPSTPFLSLIVLLGN